MVNFSLRELKITENKNASSINNQQEFKNKFQNIAFDFLDLFKDCADNLSKEELECIIGLAKNKNLVVTKADKGNSVVIMNKNEYIEKLSSQLQDTSKFVKLNYDPTLEREKSLQSKLYYLKRIKAITEEEYKYMRPSGSKPGVLYGLPKVHKSGTPIRPIISSIGTYNYNLAKFLAKLIEPVISDNSYILKDSFDFVNRVSDIGRNGEFVDHMVSFDIVSLFPNIPLEETIQDILNMPFNSSNQKVNGLTNRQFKQLLEIATEKSHFLFDGVFYDQKDGVGMGSPLAPILANVCMSKFEKSHMVELKEMGLNHWSRFVDDTFATINNQNCIKPILDFLNTRHPNLKFTCEEEQDNSLAFLDVLVTKKDKKLQSSIFRKKTFTGVYLNWNSLTARKYKIGLITCLLDRAWNICSSSELYNNEVNMIRGFLLQNDFPLDVINKTVETFNSKKSDPKPSRFDVPRPSVSITLPFISDQTTNAYEKKLRELISKFYPQADLQVAYKAQKQLKDLFRCKDQIPKLQKSKVIYKLKCLDCNAFYIGKTKRHLATRVQEHKEGKGDRDQEISAVFKHMKDNGHQIDFENVEILDMAQSDYRLGLKESMYIKKFKPSLNIQVQSDLFKLITIGN